jgi:hypothetical protein
VASLYLDENIPKATARFLTERGHDAKTARQLGLEAFPDGKHLLVATQQRRILVTHNSRDFLLLHNAWLHWTNAWQISQRHPGILLFPQMLAADIAQVVHDLMTHEHPLYARPIENELYTWNKEHGWVRGEHL